MKKRERIIPPFPEIIRRLKYAGIAGNAPANSLELSGEDPGPLDERIRKVLQITENQKPANMLFFVMYDIEDTKVRVQIASYLLKKGCFRIQKSIFLAELPKDIYDQIKSDLTEVQACYDNPDSILLVPISTDYLQAMKIIGKNIDIDIITKNKNTLFF